MPSGGRRRIDRVLDPDYVKEIEQLPLAAVRALRDEAAQEETDLSYKRRMLHGRIDMIRAEQQRRQDGGSAIVDQLATILATNVVGPATGLGRYQTQEPSKTHYQRRRVETMLSNVDLSNVAELTDEQLSTTLSEFTEEEATVSQDRRAVQVVVDLLNADIASRYRLGTASVDELLAIERHRHSA